MLSNLFSNIASAIKNKDLEITGTIYPSSFANYISNLPIFISFNNSWTSWIMRTLSGAYSNSTVDYIGSFAFYGMPITSVTFTNVVSISYQAFYGCKSLITISFPKCISINGYAFGNCSSLTLASFPSCSYIGDHAFASCINMTSAFFPKCTSIGYSTFYYCQKLSSVYLPSCIKVDRYAFYNCRNLSTISLSKCTTLGSYAFGLCSGLQTVSLPECSSIGSYAFAYCSFQTVSFPKCTFIGSAAFYSCTALSSLYLLTSTVPILDNITAFSGTKISGGTGKIYVLSSMVDSFKAATNWAAYSARIVGQ